MENGSKLILVIGGARSGKSTFAESYAAGSGQKVVYIATAAGDDQEMLRRIEAHRQRRPRHFITIEERSYPHRVLEKEKGKDTFFLLDCLTLLLSNHLLKGDLGDEDAGILEERAKKMLDYLANFLVQIRKRAADFLVVANEVGMGLVPANPLGRVFRDLAGRANQLVAGEADEVWLMVCGIARRIK